MKQLRRFTCSDPHVQAALNEIVDAVNARTPSRAPGVRIRTSGRGFSISSTSRRGGGGGAVVGSHPFDVLHVGQANNGAPLVAVSSDSYLMLSERASDQIPIAGLGEPFALEIDELIWLEITFDDGELVSSAEISYGDPWGGYDSPVEFDEPTAQNKRQTKARMVIAYTQAVPNPNPYADRPILRKDLLNPGPDDVFQLVQCVNTHLLLCRRCFEADTVQLPVPYIAPAPAFDA